MSCDKELANEWARCSRKNASYITNLFVPIMMAVETIVNKWLLPVLVNLATTCTIPVVTNVGDRFCMTLHYTHDEIHMLAT